MGSDYLENTINRCGTNMDRYVLEGLVGWSAIIAGVVYNSPWLVLAGFVFTITRRLVDDRR
jgi:hypothetical protein